MNALKIKYNSLKQKTRRDTYTEYTLSWAFYVFFFRFFFTFLKLFKFLMRIEFSFSFNANGKLW